MKNAFLAMACKKRKEYQVFMQSFNYHFQGSWMPAPPPPPSPSLLHPSSGFVGHKTSACSTHHREWVAGGPGPDGRADPPEAAPEPGDKPLYTRRVRFRSNSVDRSLFFFRV